MHPGRTGPREAEVYLYNPTISLDFAGCILEGPDPEKLKPIVEQAMPMLIELLTDGSVVVRDTGAWTVGRVCEILPEAVLHENCLNPLLMALIKGLEAEPRVASNICWVRKPSLWSIWIPYYYEYWCLIWKAIGVYNKWQGGEGGGGEGGTDASTQNTNMKINKFAWQTTYRLQQQEKKWKGVTSTHITIRNRTGVTSTHITIRNRTGVTSTHITIRNRTGVTSTYITIRNRTGVTSTHITIRNRTGVTSTHITIRNRCNKYSYYYQKQNRCSKHTYYYQKQNRCSKHTYYYQKQNRCNKYTYYYQKQNSCNKHTYYYQKQNSCNKHTYYYQKQNGSIKSVVFGRSGLALQKL